MRRYIGPLTIPAPYRRKAAGAPLSTEVPVLRVQLMRESSRLMRRLIDTAEDAAEVIGDYLAFEDREHFVILLLDVRSHLLGIHTVSIGTLNMAVISPREVFKAAILGNAAAIVLGHNHPSGDTTPSPEDYHITEQLKQAGKLLDIDVLDHIIVGSAGNYRSLLRL